MKTIFHTNLDEAQQDVYSLNANVSGIRSQVIVPRVGERIVFPFERWEVDGEKGRSRRCEFELEVVSVRYNYVAMEALVELHIPPSRRESIYDWTVWFRKFRHGKSY